MAAIRYVDCNLTVLDEERTEYHDTFRSRPVSGVVRSDQDAGSLVKDTIDRLHRWVASEDRSPYIEREDLELLGRHLYYLLFDEKIGTAFEESYRGFRRSFDANARLRLVLAFHEEAKELASYPWEFLFMPKRENQPGFFVCAEKRTELILTRVVPDSIPDDTLRPEETDLKILVVFANPRELGGRLDAQEFLEAIRSMKRIRVKPITQPEELTKDAVAQAIKGFEPHIFHFVGHGDAEKGIALLKAPAEIQQHYDETGETRDVDWVDSRALNSLFAGAMPRLVFLHACKGATASATKAFNSTAHDLVYDYEVPAVVAMQYGIENVAAARFARTFYQQISEGASIDIAVSEGRWELRSSQRGEFADRAFGTPLVYVNNERAERAMILHEAEDKPAVTIVKCPHCGANNVSGNPFCGQCRKPLAQDDGAVADASASQVMARESQIETGRGGTAPPSGLAQPPPEPARPERFNETVEQTKEQISQLAVDDT